MSGTRNFAALVLIGLAFALAAPSMARADGDFPVGPKASFRDCPDCPTMVVLPLGQFMMGSPPTERYRFDNEGPQHLVHVTHPIAIGMYLVTAGDIAAWRGTTLAPGSERLPAVMITWFEMTQYAQWLSKRTGHAYRLPTEAEYEYAERAGTTTAYYWGPALGKGNANCIGCGSALDGTGSTPVGAFPPNRWGLYDMAGDTFVWVQDCYIDSYKDAPSDASIARESTTGDCPNRVLRSSSWFNLPSFLRSAYRFREVPTTKSARRGFRLVREADPAP